MRVPQPPPAPTICPLFPLQKCEEVEVLKGQVSQEQELRAVVESCLMERDVAWSEAQAQLREVQAVAQNAGVLLERLQ